MADNVALPPATGNVAADEVAFSGDTAKVQLVRVVDVVGAEGSKSVVPFSDIAVIDVTSSGLTTDTTAYTVGDQLGTLMTLTDAVRESGGSGVITGMTLIDSSDVIGAVDAIIFESSVTLAADNAAFAISDADANKILSMVTLFGGLDIGGNRICVAQNLQIPFVCSGSANLYVALITRTANAVFAAGATSLKLRTFVER